MTAISTPPSESLATDTMLRAQQLLTRQFSGTEGFSGVCVGQIRDERVLFVYCAAGTVLPMVSGGFRVVRKKTYSPDWLISPQNKNHSGGE
jgi:hypothetical protein